MRCSPLLVIVTGLPCTGKTALSRRLAEEVPLPIIAKDDIKESLYGSLGWSDREWSRQLGRASIILLYQIIESILKAGMPVIAETYFHPDLARGEFQAIQARAPFRPFVIECVADGEVLWQRWQSRIASGERHPGHADNTDLEHTCTALMQGRNAPRLEIGGIQRIVDTTDFTAVNLQGLAEEIRANL